MRASDRLNDASCTDLGVLNTAVAAKLRGFTTHGGKWRARFTAERLDGLIGEPRSGRPPSILLDQVEEVLVATAQRPVAPTRRPRSTTGSPNIFNEFPAQVL